MSYIKVWIHLVWGTKRREQIITPKNKSEIINHIRENAKQKGICIDHLNGHREHLHCLIRLNGDQSISKLMQFIKGESSFWINKKMIAKTKFKWAKEFYAVSVSESQVNSVRRYIRNQEQHHMKKSWKEEYEEFIEKFGFVQMKG